MSISIFIDKILDKYALIFLRILFALFPYTVFMSNLAFHQLLAANTFITFLFYVVQATKKYVLLKEWL